MRTRSPAAAFWPAWLGIIMAATVSVALGQPAAISAPPNVPTASAPATQPDSEIILFRVGDKGVVTQEDFAAVTQAIKPEDYEAQVMPILSRLMEQELLACYLADHPELVPPERLKESLELKMKKANFATLEETKQKFAEKGLSFEAYCQDERLRLARSELLHRGHVITGDLDTLKKIFDEHPGEYDGSTVEARQIMLNVAPTDTPAQRAAKRTRIAKMREDILAGKRTWDQCIAESDFRVPNGTLGTFPRHGSINEIITKAAFGLDAGQFSDVIETPMGYHLLHVVAKKPSTRKFEDAKAQRDMKLFLVNSPYQDAIIESFLKHPVVGVQAPRKPAKIGTSIKPSAPSFADLERMLATRPAASRPATTRPAVPGTITPRPPARATSMPAAKPIAKPATRPAAPTVPANPAAK